MKVLAIGVAVALLSGCAWVGRVGLSNTGQQPMNAQSTFGGDISANGRFVVFMSDADNLVPNDTNHTIDVFLRDNQTQTTERVSVAADGAQSPLGGMDGKVSADGRYVAFSSSSASLVSGDTNSAPDVFLRDRQAGTTVRISIANNGTEADGPSTLDDMTPDARYFVFTSDADNLGPLDDNGVSDVFVRDRIGASTRRISQAAQDLGNGIQSDADSYGGSISNDGAYVTFISAASTIDPDYYCGCTDVFVRTRSTSTVKRVTVTADDTPSDGDSVRAAISGNGQWIAFESDADTLIDPPDSNGYTDVFVTKTGSRVFERASDSLEPSDPQDPTTAHDADSNSELGGISDDGRFVLFQSQAQNLVRDTLHAASDAFVRDRANHTTVLAATTQAMKEPAGGSAFLDGSTANAISGDGRYVLFSSTATDVIVASSDTNGNSVDVFLWSNPVPFLVSASPATIARGSTTTVALHGISLHGAGALALFGAGVTVNSVTAVNETEIDVNVTVAADAVPGPRTPLILQVGTGVPGYTGGGVFLTDGVSVV